MPAGRWLAGPPRRCDGGGPARPNARPRETRRSPSVPLAGRDLLSYSTAAISTFEVRSMKLRLAGRISLATLFGSLLPSPLFGQRGTDSLATLERARRLHRETPMIDTHNDLPEMIHNRAHGDLTKMD